MTSELRPAVEVWREAEAEAIEYNGRLVDSDYAAAAVIEADREAVRAEIAAEVADYLKEGETIAECIARNRADANVLLEMFAAERVKVENYAKTMKIISDIANREAAELAKYKAPAETLAGALELYAQWGGDTAREALRQYKEARDEAPSM